MKIVTEAMQAMKIMRIDRAAFGALLQRREGEGLYAEGAGRQTFCVGQGGKQVGERCLSYNRTKLDETQ